MKPLKIKLPKYRLHQPKGRSARAAVTINGQHIYLGEYDSPESHERYKQEIAKWLCSQQDAAAVPTLDPNTPFVSINQLIETYTTYAEGRYVNEEGDKTSEFDCILSAVHPLIEAFGSTNAREFGPKSLKQVRALMMSLGWTHGTINKAVGRIKRMFKWAVSEELVPPTIPQALETLAGLDARTVNAKKSEPVRPVDEEHVRAIYPYVSPQVQDMLELLLLCGCRPGEIVKICWAEIQPTDDPEVWEYQPSSHKTKWRGHERSVFLGPKARLILEKYRDRDKSVPIFSPSEAEQVRSVKRRACRRSPLTPSQKARKPKSDGKRRPGSAYDSASLRRAVTRGIEAANHKLPQGASLIPDWSPGQIRHTAGTAIRHEDGLEAAQVVLGHKHADVTQVYAERDKRLAVQVAKKRG